MTPDEKYAKLLALSVLYEKGEQNRDDQIRRIYCRPADLTELLEAINHEDFKQWVISVAHLFQTPCKGR